MAIAFLGIITTAVELKASQIAETKKQKTDVRTQYKLCLIGETKHDNTTFLFTLGDSFCPYNKSTHFSPARKTRQKCRNKIKMEKFPTKRNQKDVVTIVVS